ncbi:MAG: DsbA family protein [Myxococcota bacterium]
MNRTALVLGSVAVLAGTFAAGAFMYRNEESQQAAIPAAGPSPDRLAALERADAQRLGDPAAKVTIVEFFDPACETCAEFAPYMKALVDRHPGKVQIVYRYAPLHPGSDQVSAMLEAARKQDKYFEALEIMFSTQATWASHHAPNPDALWGLLEQGGLDIVKLRTDMVDPAIAAAVAEDVKDGRTLGVKATPEFFVNGKPLPKWGMRQLTELVQAELAANY